MALSAADGIAAIAAALREGRVTAGALAAAALQALDAPSTAPNAVVARDVNGVLAAAESLDRAPGASGPLAGVPVVVGDLMAVAGLPHALGSGLFRDRPAEGDEPAVARLRAVGALILGKTAVPELGHKPMTDSRTFGIVRNPKAPERTAGGAEGGAAAAIAAGLAAGAIGIDRVGGVRVPAASCGIVGLKPTPGRLAAPRLGDALSAPCGLMAGSVGDVTLMLEALNGPDPSDPLTLARGPDRFALAADPTADLVGLRVAWMARLANRTVHPEVYDLCWAAVQELAVCGVELSRPQAPADWAVDLANTLAAADLAARFGHLALEAPERLDPSTLRYLQRGLAVEAELLRQAPLLRAELYGQVNQLFAEADLLAMPALASAPPLAEQDPQDRLEIEGELLGTLETDWAGYAAPFSLTGHPAVTVPVGRMRDGAPVGLQLVAPWWEERRLLSLAAAIERLMPLPLA